MNDWWIVSSITGKTDDGFPFGRILCRTYTEALEVARSVKHPIFTKYIDLNKQNLLPIEENKDSTLTNKSESDKEC